MDNFKTNQAIGICIGTQTSVVAIVEDRQVKILANSSKEEETPTILAY